MTDQLHALIKGLHPDRGVIIATIDDAAHFTDEEREQIIRSYPAHERDARTKGIPTMGSGRVFPVSDELITIAPRDIPRHWPQIVGVDFGIDHPFAAVRLAWDRDDDCVYVTHCHRVKGEIPALHAVPIKAWGSWIPVAWPHDGLNRDKGSGEQLASIYRTHGLNMLPERAEHAEGGNGVEAGITDMLERMQTGRLKVFSGLNDWFEEFRLYHRKDGLIVKERDDLMSSSRYGIMMLREAVVKQSEAIPRRARLGTMA